MTTVSTRLSRSVHAISAVVPGLGVAVALAVIATGVGRLVPVLGGTVAALLLGGLIAVIRRPGRVLLPGITVAGRYVLQAAVVLLGARLSLAEVVSVGRDALPVMVTTLVVCLAAVPLLGRWLGVDRDIFTLIGVGTGICGASAIAATAPVIGAAAADVAYAVATIFVFNIAAIFVFPVLGHTFGLDQHAFGLFAGTAVNDTSSVVAVAAVYGSAALSVAVVTKLVRTLMIIPVSVGLAVLTARRAHGAKGTRAAEPMTIRRAVRLVPWFLIGFLAMATLRTLGVIPDGWVTGLDSASGFLIATAMAAIGLSTDRRTIATAGPKPLLLGGILWVLVTGTALGVIALTG